MAADNRTIKELFASGLDNDAPLCIQYPMAALRKTDEFELKSSLLHHIPKFHGMSIEDPNKHLKEFEVVCLSMTSVNVDGSILKMKAFPFSLLEKGKDWLYELAPETVTSWESMKQAFLEKFFLTSRVILLRKRIIGIQQNQGMRMKEPSVCGVCSIQGHASEKCPQLIENGGWESANAIGFQGQNQPMNDPYSNTYNPGARKSSQSNAKPRHKGGPNGEANWADYRVCRTIQRARFMQSNKDESEKDILETFRKVQVNIPLLEAIKQVPKYAKFLKELCTTKRRMSNKKVVKDGVIIQLADRSNAYPKGVLEDVLVQVNHLIFPADFYILDMEDSVHSTSLPILLGRLLMKTTRTKIDVFKGTLMMEFDGEVIDFNISETMRYPVDDHSCFSINVIDSLAQEYLEELNENALEIAITKGIILKNQELGAMQTHGQIWDPNAVLFNEEVVEVVAALESLPRQYGKVPLSISSSVSTKMLPSIIQAPTFELTPLPDHLKYVFLGDDETLPVIVSSSLTAHEEEKLIRVLQEHKTTIGWTLADIRGISLTTCMHRILLEERTKPSREAQCRLNPPMMEVVKKEIIKLLDCGVIYPISDSHWVSPVQVVPKKSGITVVKNDENELIPTRNQTGWRVLTIGS
ncbi:unnamed protein product [Malus baccata var. baccata]